MATTTGTLLAFAERRTSDASSSDTGDNAVAETRSTDHGCTWSSPRVIADDGANTVGNPSAVVDTDTGTVLLFTIDRVRAADGTLGSSWRALHIQSSTDDGRTFTAYAASAKDLATPLRATWHGGLTGPGHALQLHAASSPHPGRIIVPLSYWAKAGSGERWGADAIVSDDHGATWKVGYDRSSTTDQRMEGTIAELPDGRLWVSYRDRRTLAAGLGRTGAFSIDGGDSLQTDLRVANVPGVSVEGSALALTGTNAGTLLYSQPSDRTAGLRRDMAIFWSRGSGAGTVWSTPYAVQLESTPASYSDLAQLDDGTIGVLEETGVRSWHEGIAFRSLRIADVLAGTKVTSRVQVTAPTRLSPGATAHVWSTAQVAGTSAPAGTFRVTVSRTGWSRTVTVPLTSTNAGTRYTAFGPLARGVYTVRTVYVGTSRIRGSTSAAHSLTVR